MQVIPRAAALDTRTWPEPGEAAIADWLRKLAVFAGKPAFPAQWPGVPRRSVA